jgi:hypothetical protein
MNTNLGVNFYRYLMELSLAKQPVDYCKKYYYVLLCSIMLAKIIYLNLCLIMIKEVTQWNPK